ncbi:MAG TPA: single-stranded-DNA-specific exonuclease RecJ [Bryobacteraceae bacterium]|nr:single-stranded-DNA-specific exonuclease RecJ [Bryobacteraceae bacterium]
MSQETARWRRPAARWELPYPQTPVVAALREALGLEPLVAAVLAQRGYQDATAAGDFLRPALTALCDPLLMLDMDRAVARLLAAIQARELILLYGDYDVDGTSSIVVLKKAIELLGGCADFHIPDRLKDGYGMRNDVIDRAAQSGVKLIVSVDTGIRANAVVRYAAALGIDTIVTDHHLPDSELPPALAVLNPNRPGCGYPNKNLCGAGVTLKLVQALLAGSGLAPARQAALLDSFLKPVAIATVADIVPLVGENRVIVQRGLSGLRQVRNPGLRALLAVAGFDVGESPSAHQVAFRLAPRINAAGRMATANDVVELFLTGDDGRARALAEQLDTLNRERQQVETEIVETILKQCEESTAGTPAAAGTRALVFAGAGWHLGVLGIVASRLVERFCRPVFVLSDASNAAAGDAPHLTGSGRSIPAFHLLEALESMPELFTKFGGHRQAAGLTLRASELAAFQQRFHEFAAGKLADHDLRPLYKVDAEASFTELSELCIQQILSLGPFGFGNPAPVFYCAGAEMAGPPKVLKEGKHFNLPLRQNGRLLFAKAWNFGDRPDLLQPGVKLDVLFQVEDDPLSRKRGYAAWCLSVKDLRLSTT